MNEQAISAEHRSLLLEVARCPAITHCRENPDSGHPCTTVVNVQRLTPHPSHQVPEPWSGHIAQAPILFLSSNPSISTVDQVPLMGWDDEEIADFFESRFDDCKTPWILDGTKALGRDGTRLRATMFWAAIRKRAAEILEREPRPGHDYATAEIVHCKSKKETGVHDAMDHCTVSTTSQRTGSKNSSEHPIYQRIGESSDIFAHRRPLTYWPSNRGTQSITRPSYTPLSSSDKFNFPQTAGTDSA